MSVSCEDKELIAEHEKLQQEVLAYEQRVDQLESEIIEDPGDQSKIIQSGEASIKEIEANIQALEEEKANIEAEKQEIQKEFDEYKSQYKIHGT
ncbi:hypothetical protein [Persicirhabdus sediminis]|uniref:Uncharacterized protein n=1 Tax=Persicirhabdus sediminis TaxID=454144 RepID=A0A8J7MDA0_9BACT|nr:hypothetical protein [Persicirhabdus sediminis]MBK1791076.1 hypothetical protein [Persicirhabdus sediminis]